MIKIITIIMLISITHIFGQQDKIQSPSLRLLVRGEGLGKTKAALTPISKGTNFTHANFRSFLENLGAVSEDGKVHILFSPKRGIGLAKLKSEGILAISRVNSGTNVKFTSYLHLNDILEFSQNELVNSIEFSYIRARLSQPPTAYIDNVVETGAIHSHNDGKRGERVIIGIIDTGIDFEHNDFIDAAGNSRILFLWDQTEEPYLAGHAHPNNRFPYGIEWDQAAINDEIDGTPANFVTQVDSDGHGTHVAGIAAGNGRAIALAGAQGSLLSNNLGIAPAADLIIVKSSLFDVTIVDALEYIQMRAGALGRPFSVNLSIGHHDGYHDGTHYLEQTIDNMFNAANEGRCISIAAGNSGDINDAAHSMHEFNIGFNVYNWELNIPAYVPKAGVENDGLEYFFQYEGPGDITVTVISPTGWNKGFNFIVPYDFDMGEHAGSGRVSMQRTIDGPNRQRFYLKIEDYLDVDGVTEQNVIAGDWQVEFIRSDKTAKGTLDGYFHNKLDIESQMIGRIQSPTTKATTVAIPATAHNALCVGSYNTNNKWWVESEGYYVDIAHWLVYRTLSTFSGRGPTRDGRTKPDICAPGMYIMSARSTDAAFEPRQIDRDGLHVALKGTSMAAPVVCGMGAIRLQYEPTHTATQVRDYLMTLGQEDPYTGKTPNNDWGNGQMVAPGPLPLKPGINVINAMARKY
jgi:subtilisin family serine protease